MDRAPIELHTFHHVYNRGVDKRSVFSDDSDRELFLRYLLLLNDTEICSPRALALLNMENISPPKDRLVDICAFCLMHNHYHMLLHERTEGGISKFMQRVGTAYTMYFNEKNERSGALFQGRFKSRYIDDESYLMAVIDYIHINPVCHKENGEKSYKRKQDDFAVLDSYKWSSYSDFCDEQSDSKIINTDVLREYLELPSNYKDWLRDVHDFSTISDLMID